MQNSQNLPGPTGSAYARGVAHLKRAQYREAVAAFSEAIEFDPDSANAYTGRALAHRGLGDDAAATKDNETAAALGGPERSAWDRLFKRAMRQWRGDLSDPNWVRADPLSRDAFLLREWTWQIYNGGLPQWVANGFGLWAEDLARAAEAARTDSARAVAAIVRDVAQLLVRFPGAREAMFRMVADRAIVTGWEDELFRELSRCEDRYQRSGIRPGEFVGDIEAWLERRAAETWSVMRQDDNGNRFVVEKHLSQGAADRLVRELDARGHKQLYWAESEDRGKPS